MIKFGAGKKLIIIMLSICTILLALFSVVAIVENDKLKNMSPQAGTIRFGRLPCYADWDLYRDNDTFEIGDAVALEAFSDSVKNEDKDGNYCTFEGKIVKLTADIDWENYYQDYLDCGYFDEAYPGEEDKVLTYEVVDALGRDYNGDYKITKAEMRRYYQELANNKTSPVWQPVGSDMSGSTYQGTPGVFKGTFDGQGHTIKNLRYKVSKVGDGFYDTMYVGFFAKINGATVKNVKIKNLTINNYNSLNCGFYISAMAASAYGATIENCVVESVWLNWNVKAHEPYFGGFYCYNAGYTISIKNCLIKDFNIYEQDGNLSRQDVDRIFLLGPAKSITETPTPITAEYVYENVILNNINSPFAPINPYVVPGGLDFTYYLVNQSMEDYALGNNLEYLSKEGAITRLMNNNLWYQAPDGYDWNNGWPYLIDFIDFNTYAFEAGSNGSIKDSGSSRKIVVSVPEDIEVNPNLQMSTLVVWGKVAAANPNDGYKFSHWTQKGNTYTANFTRESYDIYIKDIVYKGKTYKPEFDCIDVLFNEILTLKVTYEKDKMLIYIKGWAFELPNKYEIKSFGSIGSLSLDNGSVTIPDLDDYKDESGKIYIQVEIKLKDYEIKYE